MENRGHDSLESTHERSERVGHDDRAVCLPIVLLRALRVSPRAGFSTAPLCERRRGAYALPGHLTSPCGGAIVAPRQATKRERLAGKRTGGGGRASRKGLAATAWVPMVIR